MPESIAITSFRAIRKCHRGPDGKINDTDILTYAEQEQMICDLLEVPGKLRKGMAPR